MPEPAATTLVAVGMTAAGLSIFGIATGLHPELMAAGVAGGWLSLSYLPAMAVGQRISTAILSAVAAAWGAPAVAGAVIGQPWVPAGLTYDVLRFPLAMGIGLMLHTVLAPGLMALAKRKMEGA